MRTYTGRKTIKFAIRGDEAAIKDLFRTFMGGKENIVDCSYLGVRGLWGVGHHCWAAVTDKRFATITLSPFRGVRYQDIFADRIDRVRFNQPSWLEYAMVIVPALGILTSLPAMFLLVATGEEALNHLLAGISDLVQTGWGLLFFSCFVGLCVPTLLYGLLAMARRFIKRGIECRSRNVLVEAFCDPSSTPDGLRLLRIIAELRDTRLSMAVTQ